MVAANEDRVVSVREHSSTVQLCCEELLASDAKLQLLLLCGIEHHRFKALQRMVGDRQQFFLLPCTRHSDVELANLLRGDIAYVLERD
eukprot:COSAG01_NODE_13876_length_1524_cov_1.411930_2_plen_88_part_00